MSHYDTLTNCESHPLRVAYARFESDKAQCLATMRSYETMFKGYVDAQERLNRLRTEQSALLAIMADDLTADLLVDRLIGSKE